MVAAKQGDTVKVHYTGRLEDGVVFDSSADRDPLEFTIGSGQIITGFETAVVGMEPGDSVTATVSPTEGYGDHRPDLVIDVPRDRLPGDLEPELGTRLQSETEEGEVIVFTIIGTTESEVKLDANHPLAGKTLEFDIELVEVS